MEQFKLINRHWVVGLTLKGVGVIGRHFYQTHHATPGVFWSNRGIMVQIGANTRHVCVLPRGPSDQTTSFFQLPPPSIRYFQYSTLLAYVFSAPSPLHHLYMPKNLLYVCIPCSFCKSSTPPFWYKGENSILIYNYYSKIKNSI